MTYEQISQILQLNHFYPRPEVSVGKTSKKQTGLIIECPSIILMDDKKARLEEILKEKGIKATVRKFPNEGYLTITKK